MDGESGRISRKVPEKRLMWFGQVMRREEDYVGKRAISLEVQWTRKRGRPLAKMGGQNKGRHGRERHMTRADAEPRCAEATRPIHQPHMKWDKVRKKKKKKRAEI